MPFDADFAGHVAHLIGEYREGVDHAVDRVGEFGDFAFRLQHQFAFQIAVGDVGDDFRNTAYLRREIRRHGVDVIRQILPRTADAAHLRLAAEFAFGTDFARHAGDFRSEAVELIDHRVDRVFQLQNFALHIHGDFPAQVAVGDRGRDLRDVANLRGQIARHRVDAVGKILPGTRDAAHFRLAAQFAFRADFARHAGDFGREGAQLIHHRVDGVLQFQNFAAHIDGDFTRQIAFRHGRRDFRDVANLHGEVRRHRVDAVGEILPCSGNVFHVRLAAEFAFRTDFARHTSDFGREGAELIDHRVDGVFQLQNFAARIDRDLGGQIAFGDGRGDACNVTHLVGEITGHRIDRVGQILPRTGHAANIRLTAQFAFGTDFARHACDFAGESIELIHHGVDCVLQLQNLAADIDRDLASQIAFGDSGGDFGDVSNLRGEVPSHGVDESVKSFQVPPTPFTSA